MFIHEAILSRSQGEPYITRKSWDYPATESVEAAIMILPTDTPDCCIIMSVNGKNPCRGWQPTAEDLAADDWVVTRGALP